MRNFLTICTILCMHVWYLQAQTNVTDRYITNAGFDQSSSWATSNVGSGNSQTVEGWTASSQGDTWYYGASIGYGSGIKVNEATLAQDSEGNATGGALGLSAGWGCSICYTQEATLPSGYYTLTYHYYNANASAQQAHNLCGYVTADGTPHYGIVQNFPSGEWGSETLFFRVPRTQTITFSLGLEAVSGGSNDNAKLFIDRIELHRQEISSTNSSSLNFDNSKEAWSGGGTYTADGTTGVERYVGSGCFPVGECMAQTISGLEPGLYVVEMLAMASSTKNRDDDVTGITEGLTKYASLHANQASQPMVAVTRTGFDTYDTYKLYTLVKEDGNLRVSLNIDYPGTNWNVIYGVSYQRILPTIDVEDLPQGTFFLRDEEGRYLSRGADWGTRTIVADWGLPVTLTPTDDALTLRFSDGGGLYISVDGSNIWSDKATANTYKLVSLQDHYLLKSNESDAYLCKHTGDDSRIYADGTLKNAIRWSFDTPSQHAAHVTELRQAATTWADKVTNKNQQTYVSSQPSSVNEKYQGGYGTHFSGTFYVPEPGIYKFVLPAFYRLTNNDNTYALHTQGADCPPAYIYFEHTRIPICSVYDESVTASTGFTGNDGKNYPNGTGGALTAFKEGHYRNTIYVSIGKPGTVGYGIVCPGTPATDNARWCCWSADGIEITRYYDLEGDASAIQDLCYKYGDVNIDNTVNDEDVPVLADMILGKRQANIRAHIVNQDAVNISDLTALQNILAGRASYPDVEEHLKEMFLYTFVHAEQSGNENASSAAYTLTRAAHKAYPAATLPTPDMRQYLTTLRIEGDLSDVASVSIYSLDNISIAGGAKLEVTEGIPSFVTYDYNSATTYANSTLSDVVTVNGSWVNGACTAYLLPVELPSGVLVTVRTNAGQYYSQTFPEIQAGKTQTLQFSQSQASNNWMATIPGNVPFSFLTLPCTHDAATKGTGSAAETQSLSISEQMNIGIRALDLRPKAFDGSWFTTKTTADNMVIYHGIISTGVKFKDALSTVCNFLDQHPTETIFILLHEEDGNNLQEWRDAVLTNLNNVKSHIKTIDANMTLNDCRGKMVIISRDDVGDTRLCGKTGWGGSFAKKDVVFGQTGGADTNWDLYYQDEYDDSNYKTNRIVNLEKLLKEYIQPRETESNVIFFNSSNVADHIQTGATTVNPAILNSEVFKNSTGRWGIMSGDFIGNSNYSGDQLLRMIISQNFKYIFKGRSRVNP